MPTPHRTMTAVLSLLGLLLVIGSAINAKSSSWYLLAILTLGTIHTAYLAMTQRTTASPYISSRLSGAQKSCRRYMQSNTHTHVQAGVCETPFPKRKLEGRRTDKLGEV
jgi:hypothetical protein